MTGVNAPPGEGRIASLDGLRAVSILLVLFGHLAGTRNFPVQSVNLNIAAMAHSGVQVFFVISGFLITSILKKEWSRAGEISLKKFYYRRSLRIFPPFYVFLFAMGLCFAAGWITIPAAGLASAATYTSNFLEERGWYLGHTWSLSVEEQFYIIWPGLIVLAGWRNATALTVLMVLVSPLARAAAFLSGRQDLLAVIPTDTDSIATGCLLAIWFPRIARVPLYARLRRIPGFKFYLLAPVVLAILFAQKFSLWFMFGQMASAGIALFIYEVLTGPARAASAVLNWSPLVYIGQISYSLYLWQQPFLNRGGSLLLHEFPLNLALAFAAALASYYIVEKPTLRLRQRFEPQLFPRRRAEPQTLSAAS